jgi:hypothetical protein
MRSEVPWFWLAAVFGIGIFEADNIYRGWKKQDVYTKGISELKVSTVHCLCQTFATVAALIRAHTCTGFLLLV